MKKIIIMLLALLAIGIVSAKTIHIHTDMIIDNIDVYRYDHLGTCTLFNSHGTSKDISGLPSGVYKTVIEGKTMIDGFPVTWIEDNIWLITGDEVTIEKYYDTASGDPGTGNEQ